MPLHTSAFGLHRTCVTAVSNAGTSSCCGASSTNGASKLSSFLSSLEKQKDTETEVPHVRTHFTDEATGKAQTTHAHTRSSCRHARVRGASIYMYRTPPCSPAQGERKHSQARLLPYIQRVARMKNKDKRAAACSRRRAVPPTSTHIRYYRRTRCVCNLPNA